MENDGQGDAALSGHQANQISAAKAAVLAVTALNSGSWLAILTQVGALRSPLIGVTIAAWALGALIATSLWLLVYRNAIQLQRNAENPSDESVRRGIDRTIVWGRVLLLLALGCFALGAASLALAVASAPDA